MFFVAISEVLARFRGPARTPNINAIACNIHLSGGQILDISLIDVNVCLLRVLAYGDSIMQASNQTLSDIVGQSRTLMNVVQAAEYIGVQANTLNCWRCTGRYSLPFLKIGRNIRYRQSDLDLWLEARVQANGTTA